MNIKYITLLLIPAILLSAQDRTKPKLPSELKAQAEAIHEQVKAGELTREQAKQEINQLLEDNKPTRPSKPNRPALPEEIKTQIAELKDKQQEMALAKKELRESLKDASKEEREQLIDQFKQANKEQHQTIKQQAREIKKQIRETVETGDTRTSDV